MSAIDIITIGENIICCVDADPSTEGNGIDAQIGSIAFHNVNGNIYVKWGNNNIDWNPINSNFKTFFSNAINAKAAGPIIIGTTRNNGNEKFYPQVCQLILINAEGVITPPRISVGTNEGAYNNIVNGIIVNGLSEAGSFYSFNMMDKVIPRLDGGSEIYLNIDSEAEATTYSVISLIRGFYA